MLDADGKVLGERAFEHGGAGLSAMADWLLSLTTGQAGDLGVALETPRGPLVGSLMERRFVVPAINPKQLDRFSPAGATDDRRDARVLASALRTDPHCLRRLESTDPTIVELREWSHLSEDLTRERTRLGTECGSSSGATTRSSSPRSVTTSQRPGHSTCAGACRRRAPRNEFRGTTLARLLTKHRIRQSMLPRCAGSCERRPSR